MQESFDTLDLILLLKGGPSKVLILWVEILVLVNSGRIVTRPNDFLYVKNYNFQTFPILKQRRGEHHFKLAISMS